MKDLRNPFVRMSVIAVVVIGGSFFYAHFFRMRTIFLTDIAKPMVVSLRSDDERPTHISVELTGDLNGEALLEWDCDEPEAITCRSQKRIGPGEVEMKREGDWYAQNYVIKYTPSSGVASGRLKVEYRF